MKLIHPLASSLAFQSVESYLVTPDGVAAPGSNTDCSAWIQASYEITYEIVELYYDLIEAQFEEWVSTIHPAIHAFRLALVLI